MTDADDDAWQPRLAPAVMLRHDARRDTDLLLLPERVVVLKGGAGQIIGLCDGSRSVRAIIGELSERFPTAPVHADVAPFLQRLRQEGWIR